MKSKERMTLLVFMNADRTNNVPLKMKSKLNNYWCFKHHTPKLHYHIQSKPWLDKKPFMKWWKEFLDRIHKNTNVKLLLNVDDCGPHGGTLTVNIGQVKVVLLPPNVKNVYQPIEAVFSAMTKKTIGTGSSARCF